MFLRKFIHILAVVARPILRLAGIKGGTVADKTAEGVEIIDKALPPEKPSLKP